MAGCIGTARKKGDLNFLTNIERNTGQNMEYKEFEDIFNGTIFEGLKSDLVKKIANYPERYTGLFRPTKPKVKVLQNLFQSYEIGFGDAFEKLIERYLAESGFTILNKRLNYGGGYLKLDQIFSNKDNVFFVEQKIRDDHDSSKKRGQIDNFDKKIAAILAIYETEMVEGFFYFIDDSFNKNESFYQSEIERLSSNHGLSLHLSYGKDLFDQIGKSHIWGEIISHLKEWKTNIPDLPEINFDENPDESFEEIKKLSPRIYQRLFSPSKNLDSVLRVLFPESKTLILLANFFEQEHRHSRKEIYRTLKDSCDETVRRLTG